MENNKLELLTKPVFSTLDHSGNSSSSSGSNCSISSSGGGATSSRKRKYSDESQSEKDNNCSYTAMIAQAIMKTPFKRATLSEIYNYMSNAFEILKKRGNGWRNCVRHTLSLNECFVKLNRPENGRSCNWTVHPSYFDAFLRGDYRKRRSNRKKVREQQWMTENRLSYPQQSTPTHSNIPYLSSEHLSNFRQSDLDRMAGQQNTTPSHPPPSMWHSYVSALENSMPPNSKSTNPQDIAYYHNMYSNEHHQLPPQSQSQTPASDDKTSPSGNPAATCPSTHSMSHNPGFPLPNYSISPSSSSEYEHHNNFDLHASRLRYNRNSSTSFPYKNSGGSSDRFSPFDNINKTPYATGQEQMPTQHFQFDSTCYGNFSTRSYRTEYF